jgi:hypothetical protein
MLWRRAHSPVLPKIRARVVGQQQRRPVAVVARLMPTTSLTRNCSQSDCSVWGDVTQSTSPQR